jgi:hypothetical protein
MFGLVISNKDEDENKRNILKFLAKSFSCELRSLKDEIVWTKTFNCDTPILKITPEDMQKLLYKEYKKFNGQNIYLKYIFPDPVVDELNLRNNVLTEKNCSVIRSNINNGLMVALEFYEDIEPFGYRCSITKKYYISLEYSSYLKNLNLRGIIYKHIKLNLIRHNDTIILKYDYDKNSIHEEKFILDNNELIVNPNYHKALLQFDYEFLEYIDILYKSGRIDSKINIVKIE